MKQLFRLSILIAILFATISSQAQSKKLTTSPFHHLLPPVKSNEPMLSLSNSVTAYRFVLPFAGYSPITKQISTGLGYGWNKLHFVDSTQSYYTDLAIFGAIFANGNIDPSPYNFVSIGVGVGVFNDLIMVVPSYNLPTATNKGGAFDLKISFGLTFK